MEWASLPLSIRMTLPLRQLQRFIAAGVLSALTWHLFGFDTNWPLNPVLVGATVITWLMGLSTALIYWLTLSLCNGIYWAKAGIHWSALPFDVMGGQLVAGLLFSIGLATLPVLCGFVFPWWRPARHRLAASPSKTPILYATGCLGLIALSYGGFSWCGVLAHDVPIYRSQLVGLVSVLWVLWPLNALGPAQFSKPMNPQLAVQGFSGVLVGTCLGFIFSALSKDTALVAVIGLILLTIAGITWLGHSQWLKQAFVIRSLSVALFMVPVGLWFFQTTQAATYPAMPLLDFILGAWLVLWVWIANRWQYGRLA